MKPSMDKSSPLANCTQPVAEEKFRIRREATEDVGIEESVLARINFF